MIKRFFILFVVIVLAGCSIIDDGPYGTAESEAKVKMGATTFEKVTLEGHEYWVRTGSYAGGLEHSASCPCHDKKEE